MATAFFAPTHTDLDHAGQTVAKPASSGGFWKRVLDRLIAARAAEANQHIARYRHIAQFRQGDAVLADAFKRAS